MGVRGTKHVQWYLFHSVGRNYVCSRVVTISFCAGCTASLGLQVKFCKNRKRYFNRVIYIQSTYMYTCMLSATHPYIHIATAALGPILVPFFFAHFHSLLCGLGLCSCRDLSSVGTHSASSGISCSSTFLSSCSLCIFWSREE